jgi:hypothetical protein
MHEPLDSHRSILDPWSRRPDRARFSRPAPARIARVWRGVTAASAAADYLEYVRETGVTECLRTSGNRGVVVLRRLDGDEAHFLFLSLWEGVDAVRAFAGPNFELARYFPDDARWLRELTPRVDHYLVSVLETSPHAG